MQIRIEEANKKLKTGEFEKAKKIFSELLDISPENPELIAGFYIASYWDNRLDKILKIPEGIERGLFLNESFKKFEKDLLDRKYPRTMSFESILICVLQESCSQLRQGYQRDGKQIMTKEIMIILTANLIRIRDYKNCSEMIDYIRKYQDIPREFYFYKAECLYHTGEHRKSRMLYRSSFLYYQELLPLDLVESEPLYTAINDLKKNFNDDDLKECLPVYCIEKGLLPEMEELTGEEIRHFVSEVFRLDQSRNTVKQDILFKIENRILHYGLNLIYALKREYNSDLYRKIRQKIESVDRDIIERTEANLAARKKV